MSTEAKENGKIGLILLIIGVVCSSIYLSFIDSVQENTFGYFIFNLVFTLGAIVGFIGGIQFLFSYTVNASREKISSYKVERLNVKSKANSLNEIQRIIFPGGNTQIEKEISEVRALLDFKYTKDEIKQTYIHAAAMYFIADDKSSERIIKSILYNKSSVVTKEDAFKIFKYLESRFIKPNPLDALVNKISDGMSESDKLFLVAKGGIVELKKAYKDLTDKGKFEVIIFNSLIVLRVYRANHPEKYSSVEQGFYKSLINQAKTYQINTEPEKLMSFINSRFKFYAEEIDSLHVIEGYFPGKLYSAFYLKPLAANPEPSFDLGEILQFFNGLTTMMKWVNDNTKEL